MDRKLKLILLIDDNKEINLLFKRMIMKAGVTERVDVCVNGQDALDYLKRVGPYANMDKDIPQPDIVFLDINMPIMDGWEFLENYNQLPEAVKAGQLVIMLTTSLNPDDKRRAEENGFVDKFMIKPFKKQDLFKIVDEYYSKKDNQ